MKYSIANEYTKTPGVRTGLYSGEDFREKVLIKLLKNLQDNDILTINLDGGFGYSSSFLEEAFGGLVRKNKFKKEDLLKKIKIISNDEKKLIDDVEIYIVEAIPENNEVDKI